MTSELEEDWRDSVNTLSDGTSYILKKEILTDVVFKFSKSHETICAHKCLLAMGSSVFENMFSGNTNLTLEMEITIDDFSKESFLDMIKYIYTHQIKISEKNILEISKLAQTYKIKSLEMECSMLKEDTKYYLKHLTSMNVRKDLLEFLLNLDQVNCSEYNLFEYVMKWAKNECDRSSMEQNSANIRCVLGELIYLIRFPTMTNDEFVKCYTDEQNLLTEIEIGLILILISTKRKNTTRFNNKNRCVLPCNDGVVKEFNLHGTAGTAKKCNFSSFKFSVNTKCMLSGVRCYFSNATGKHSLSIVNGNGLECLKLYDQRKYPVMFADPILLIPGKEYLIQFHWNVDMHGARIFTYAPNHVFDDIELTHISSINGRIEKLFLKKC